MKEIKKKILINEDGIKIIDEELMKKLNSKKLSASMLNSFLSSPGEWIIETYILPLIEYEETPHLIRGNYFHSIMEEFFSLPQEKRTDENLRKLTVKVFRDKYSQVGNEGAEWVKTAIRGYLSMGFQPQQEVITTYKNKKNEDKLGLEYSVEGKFGNCQRNVKGFVDKMITTDDGIVIQDWKTGAKAKDYDPNKPSGPDNDFNYILQQTAYSMLLEADGFKIKTAELIYPIAKKVLTVDVLNPEIREKVIKEFELLDEMFTKCIQENFFPFKEHIYSRWAGLFSPKFKKPKYPIKINKKEFLQHVKIEVRKEND